jgi:RNA polymerase subunit RPABC4/transcription elongation factor Spt4
MKGDAVHACTRCYVMGCQKFSCPICHPEEHQHGVNSTFKTGTESKRFKFCPHCGERL